MDLGPWTLDLGGRNSVGRFESCLTQRYPNNEGTRVWWFSRARYWSVKSLRRLVPNGLGSGGKKVVWLGKKEGLW